MSECSLCGEYSDCLHPVDFHTNPKKETPKEIEQYIGLGSFLDDMDASDADEEFWDNCARICHDCFKKFADWISWWG